MSCPKSEIFCMLHFSLMVIETEELFNHGIEGERQAGESLLARASVTGHNFVENKTLHIREGHS